MNKKKFEIADRKDYSVYVIPENVNVYDFLKRNHPFEIVEENIFLVRNKKSRLCYLFNKKASVEGKILSSPYDNGVGAIEYEYGTFDTSFIKEKVQAHPFWYARTKNKVSFNDDRTIDTLVQIDGLGRVFKTAKTGCVYKPEMKRSIDGWNVSGASIKDIKGRTIKNGQPYFEEHFSLDSIDTADLLMNYGTETKYDEKDRAVRVKVPFDLDKSSDSERYSITRTKYSIDDKKLTAESVDAKGNATETICDAKGNIISISKYGFDAGNKKLAHTTYKYNAMGEMTESYDCEGNEIKVEYDILGRKTALESRDSGRYIYEYNGEGKLQYESNSRLIAEGKRIGYFYDSFGRLSKIDYPDTKETVYEYGSPDTGEENAKGRLVRVSDSSGVMEYVYGDLGEIKEEKRTLSQKHNATLPDMTAVTKFESNYLGQMESITYPDNEVVSYAYDDAGQVVSVMGRNDHDTFNYVDMIGYDEFGQRIYMKYGNGVETTYEYKKETRLLESIRTENESRQLLQNIKYSFDAVGNIEGYVNDCKGMGNYETRQSYKYDNLYQLTGVNGFTDFNRHNISGTSTFRSNYSQTYEFDSIGNMKLKKSEEVIRTGTKTGDDLNYELNYVKDPLYAHRFISIGDRYYKYDEVGNVIGEQTGPYSEDQEESELMKSYGDSIYGVETAWGFYGDDEEADIRRAKKYHREYEWDERNQLIRSKDNNTEVMFVYGQDGKRTNKYTIDTETLYFNNYWSYYIDPSVNSCGGKVSKHIFLGETRLATSINSYNNVGTGYHGEEKDHIYFYHSDHLGSAQLVTDWQGYEYQRIEYTPYGESWVDIKIMGAASVMPLSYKFSARERDEETGLYYFGFRYLDPKYSKWLSTDPALGDYIPGAGKGNTQDSGNLPGMGGIFNHINFNLYHYAGNNPIRYTDPDGRKDDAWVNHIPSSCQPLAREFIKGDIPNWYAQQNWTNSSYFGGTEEKQFWEVACCATTILNVVSSVYQKETGSYLSLEQAELALAAAINDKKIDKNTAYVNDIAGAANSMGKYLGLKGQFSSNEVDPQYAIFAIASDNNPQTFKHFVNSYSDLYDHRYFDVWGGKDKSRIIGLMEDPEFGFLPILLRLQEGRPIRGLDYKIPEE